MTRSAPTLITSKTLAMPFEPSQGLFSVREGPKCLAKHSGWYRKGRKRHREAPTLTRMSRSSPREARTLTREPTKLTRESIKSTRKPLNSTREALRRVREEREAAGEAPKLGKSTADACEEHRQDRHLLPLSLFTLHSSL